MQNNREPQQQRRTFASPIKQHNLGSCEAQLGQLGGTTWDIKN